MENIVISKCRKQRTSVSTKIIRHVDKHLLLLIFTVTSWYAH